MKQDSDRLFPPKIPGFVEECNGQYSEATLRFQAFVDKKYDAQFTSQGKEATHEELEALVTAALTEYLEIEEREFQQDRESQQGQTPPGHATS